MSSPPPATSTCWACCCMSCCAGGGRSSSSAASLTDMERIICDQEALPPSAMVARDRAGNTGSAGRHRGLPLDDAGAAAEAAARRSRQHHRAWRCARMRSAATARPSSWPPISNVTSPGSRCWRRATPGSIARASSSDGMPWRSRPRSLRSSLLAAFADDHIHAGAAHRAGARRGDRRTHARRTDLLVPGRAVRAVRSVEEAAATRSRRASCSISARVVSGSDSPTSRKPAPRCSARSGASTAASGCTRTPWHCCEEALAVAHCASTARVIRKSLPRMADLGNALCEQGQLAGCARASGRGAGDAARAARRRRDRDRSDLARLMRAWRSSGARWMWRSVTSTKVSASIVATARSARRRPPR